MAITESTTASIDELIRVHGPGLLGYATRLLNGDRAAAEDVLQETWLRAWRHVDQLTEQKGSVRGWLTRVAHNIAMDQHRARRARPTEVELTDLSATGCRMVTFARLQVGTKIWINLPGLAPLEAIIRRSHEQDYGCEFLQPLHPAVAEHLQQQLR